MSSRDRYLIRDLVKKEFPGYRCVARGRGTYMKVRMSNKNIIQAQVSLGTLSLCFRVLYFGDLLLSTPFLSHFKRVY